MGALLTFVLASAVSHAAPDLDHPLPARVERAEVQATILRAELMRADSGGGGLRRQVRRMADGRWAIEFD